VTLPTGSTVVPSTKRSLDYMELWQARCVQAYIAIHLQTKIKTADLARVAQLSRTSFKRAFRTSFGCVPRQYVIRMRVARAQNLMTMCSDSLSQIASECGFADQSDFNNCFRRIVGERPGAWRARRRLHDSLDHLSESHPCV
jgi:transcriptional regulator GlxA family with amidase domain